MFKLVSINIEWRKHLNLVMPFLEKEQPDVLFLQEVVDKDYLEMRGKFSMSGIYAPTLILDEYRDSEGVSPSMGAAILSNKPISNENASYYYLDGVKLPVHGSVPHDEETRVLVSADIHVENQTYSIATTHFTWSAMSRPSDRQRTDIKKLLKIVDEKNISIIVGDFNAPRGGEIFSKLTEHYIDNIPKHYTTSMDKDLHKHGDFQSMVDGLFTTEDITVRNVKLVSGVSDHMAIIAEIM